MQTKKQSTIESIVKTGTGFFIGWALNYTVLPLFGFAPSGSSSFWITVIFAISSFAQNYLWRRYFNRKHQ